MSRKVIFRRSRRITKGRCIQWDQAHRGKSQQPRSLDGQGKGNRTLGVHRRNHRKDGSESSGRNGSKGTGGLEMSSSSGRAPGYRAKAAWLVAKLTDAAGHTGREEATRRRQRKIEDAIGATGVQTCALPICRAPVAEPPVIGRRQHGLSQN